MLLQHVSLKGFLAHRGRQEEEGGPWSGAVELDFRGSALWLIHGPNGSGKSSIFDAVTFALYNRARGRGKGFGDFINDRCDRADIEVEVEIGGQNFRIDRGVSRGKGVRGAGQNSGRVHRQTEAGWQIEPGTTDAVPNWTEKQLRLSYDNFVCAAILRQGEADAFLKALPSERKKQLMKLLDMDFYERLGAAANARKTQKNALLTAAATEFKSCAEVSDEELNAARARLKIAENALETADRAVQTQTEILRDATQAAHWKEEIEAKVKQQSKDASILEQAAPIEAAATRYQNLSTVLPRLEALWRVRATLADETSKLTSAQEKLAGAKADLKALEPQLDEAKIAETLANEKLSAAQSNLAAVERDKANLDCDLSDLTRIEKLEAQIAAIQVSIAPFHAILGDSEAIEADFRRLKNLETAAHHLKPLHKANNHVAQAEAESTTAHDAAEAAKTAWQEAQQRLEAHEAAVTQSDEALEILRPKIEKVARRLENLAEKLQIRAGLDGAEQCPTCDSELFQPKLQARLQAEREEWQRESEDLTTRSKAFSNQQEEQKTARTQAIAGRKIAQNTEREANGRYLSAQSDATGAKRRFEAATLECEVALVEAGNWASRIGEFDAMVAAYKTLKTQGIETRHRELCEAQSKTVEATTKMAVYRGQLRDDLPHWNAEQRADLRDLEAQIQLRLETASQNETLAKIAAQNAAKFTGDLQAQHEKFAKEHELQSGRHKDGETRVQDAESELEAELESLGAPWNQNDAARDRPQFEALGSDFEALKTAPQRLKTLQDAQQGVETLSVQIGILRENLEKLPASHRIAPAVASQAKMDADVTQHNAKSECGAATKHCDRLQNDRDTSTKCRLKRDEAEVELGRANKLAGAFGTAGLQAKIVSEAQRTISELANDTLAKLSQGNWQIDLRENSVGTELEIIARDLGRGGKERPFECLSGGERFRVAISLAIAIGQSACGGQTINTLVIDEGFGALDDLNRGLLVTELRRLSEQVLHGGRIIIVSHQDDVCSEFDFRYKLSHDSDGYAQVERITP